MPKHEIKDCPRCNEPFECKIGSIFLCQCWAVSLNEEERQYVKEKYDDCICAKCLRVEKEEYKAMQLKKQKLSPNPFTIDRYLRVRVSKVLPLMSWDIHSMYMLDHLKKPGFHADLMALEKFKDDFQWQIDLESLLKQQHYDALVLTDDEIRIVWVNPGFQKMTGYSLPLVKGKKPGILQGEDTNPDTVKSIRQKIDLKLPFEETILNYRKNGESYRCHLEIYPVKISNNTISHFLALEKEI